MSALDRRLFLKQLAAISAGAAGVGSSAPWLYAGAVQSPLGTDWQRAPCQLCGVGCGLLVGLQNGRAVGAKGDPDSPVGRGLACVKGYHSVQALYGPDRLTRARIRRGGRLVEASLQEALDVVAQRIRQTITSHGADSVGVYGSAAWSLSDAQAATTFTRALGSQRVASDAGLHTASASVGLETSFGLDGSVGCYQDIDQADVFVLWDHNIAETDPVLFSRMLERRRNNPSVRIIDLATRTTRTSYAADHSLLYTSYTELAIANALCQDLVSRNLVDRDFMARHVSFKKGRTNLGHDLSGEPIRADQGEDASWSEFVAFLNEYTPERAQQLSGLEASDIRWLAAIYGDRARNVMSVWGPELNRQVRGTWINNLIYNIHLLVGKIARPGNTALSLSPQPVVSGTGLATPDARAASAPLSLFRALENGQVRLLWIQGANPAHDLPNLPRYRPHMVSEDRFIIVSDAYRTATTELADVVLPAALWIEREGVTVNSARHLQHFARMVAAPGDATAYQTQVREVARRLGHGQLFPDDPTSLTEHGWDSLVQSHAETHNRLPTLADLRRTPGLTWPVVDGREVGWRYHTAHDPAASRAQGDFDFYGHPDHRAWIWLRPYEAQAEPTDRTYPFRLRTGRVLEHSDAGTLTGRIPTLQRALPHTYVEMHRQDAQQLGIRNRETVRLISRRGSLNLEARIDYRAQPPRGVVFVPDFDQNILVNTLMLDACCPLSGQPAFEAAVRVERMNS